MLLHGQVCPGCKPRTTSTPRGSIAGVVVSGLIAVAGANLWARSGGTIFGTLDYDLFPPLDAANELGAWHACRSMGLELSSGDEPLGAPLDAWLAEQVVSRRTVIRATDTRGFDVDLS